LYVDTLQPPESLAEFARRRLPGWALLTALVTALVVNYSFSVGRLSQDLAYDDLVYFNDGLRRLDVLYARGLLGLLRDYRAMPPHSPYSSLLAMTSFAVFGIQEWAPYAGNALLLFLSLAAVSCLLRDVPAAARALGLVLLCTTPLVLRGIGDFRPDIASGLFTALGVVVALRAKFSTCGWRRVAVVGLLFGLALWTKPATFPFTLGMVSVAVVLAGLGDAVLRVEGARFGRWFLRAGACGLLAAAVALPHFAVGGRALVGYIRTVLFSPFSEDLRLAGGKPFPLDFHLTGMGGAHMLGVHLFLFTAALLLGLVVLAWRRQREPLLRLAAIAVAAIPAFVIPTRTGIFNPFFAATFHWLVILGGLEGLRALFHTVSPMRERGNDPPSLRLRASLGFALLLAMIGLMGFLPLRGYPGARGRPEVRAVRQATAAVLDEIRRRSPWPGPVSLYVTTQMGGTVNADILAWHARKEGLVLSLSCTALATDLEEYRRAMGRADFVLACAPTRPGAAPGLGKYSSGRLAPQVLELARQDKDLEEIGRYPVPGDIEFYLFKKRSAFTARGSRGPR
jgi:hypothetical protein